MFVFCLTRLSLKQVDELDASELAPLNNQHKVYRNSNNHYIEFKPTSFEKDAGQTMIPYLDIQPVFTTPARPMGGVGIYHKTMTGYGGFVGLKLLTADVSHKINENTINIFFNQINNIFKNFLGYDKPINIQASYK